MWALEMRVYPQRMHCLWTKLVPNLYILVVEESCLFAATPSKVCEVLLHGATWALLDDVCCCLGHSKRHALQLSRKISNILVRLLLSQLLPR